eukprot:503834_1
MFQLSFLYPETKWIAFGVHIFSFIFGLVIICISIHHKKRKLILLPTAVIFHAVLSITCFMIHNTFVCVFLFDYWFYRNEFPILLHLCVFTYTVAQSFKYKFFIKRLQFLFIETEYNQVYRVTTCARTTIFCGILQIVLISFIILLCKTVLSNVDKITMITLSCILLSVNLVLSIIFIYQFNHKLFTILSDNKEFDPNDPGLFASYNLNAKCTMVSSTEDVPLLINNGHLQFTETMTKITLSSTIAIATTVICINGIILSSLFDNLDSDMYHNVCFIILLVFGVDCVINTLCIFFNLYPETCCYNVFCGVCTRCCICCCSFCANHTCQKEVEISKKRIRTTSIMELQNSNTQNGYRIQFQHKIIEDLPENNEYDHNGKRHSI